MQPLPGAGAPGAGLTHNHEQVLVVPVVKAHLRKARAQLGKLVSVRSLAVSVCVFLGSTQPASAAAVAASVAAAAPA